MTQQNVVIVGASPNEERYSNKAVHDLIAHKHHVYPIHPLATEIHGKKCYKHLTDIPSSVDTVTLYVGKRRSTDLMSEILALKPKRIIMNPGAENELLETKAKEQGIEVVQGCTLVMLRTEQF
ncbi:MAG: CoA-binding protein [Thiomargarita sp.]|nr:CoA-binding protein [Thiomargarita sp.]